MIFDARSVSRRWTTVTFVANRVRNNASSMAESPPPTTMSSCPRKKNPSHVAHVDTPCPSSRRSESIPSIFADAPVEMMTVLADQDSSPDQTSKGRRVRSTRVASWWRSSASNRAACFSIRSMSSGPRTASGKPGKFSTSVVSMS
jgi:hypothetical protein